MVSVFSSTSTQFPLRPSSPLNLGDPIPASPSCTKAPLLCPPCSSPTAPVGLGEEGTTGITLIRSVRLIKAQAQAEAQLSNSWRPQKGWDKPDVLLLGDTLGRAEEVPRPGKGKGRRILPWHPGIAHTCRVKVSADLSAKGTRGFSTHYLSHLQELIWLWK